MTPNNNRRLASYHLTFQNKTMYNVAIIGAGPAGCTLARLLLNGNVSVTVFEANDKIRTIGGSLDLHNDTGIAALKKAGLYEEFQKHCRYDAESMKLTDKRGVCLLDMAGASKESTHGRPEIDRPVLVQMLYDSLPAGTVKFSHKLRTIDQDLTLHFEHDTISGFDLIVGADGAWSKTRKFLSEIQPYYSGVSGYETTMPNAKEHEPEFSDMVRRGSLFAFDEKKAMMSQQQGDGGIKSVAWVTQREPSGLEGDEAIAHVRQTFATWSPLVTRSAHSPHSSSTTFRPIYMLPIGFRWFHKTGVTLLGDAAHLMGPFAGEGVNAAMKDAKELAEKILASSTEHTAATALDRRIEQYEEELFVRSERITKHTWDMTTAVFYEPGMPWSNIEKYVLTAASDEIPAIMWPFAVAFAYVYFQIIRWYRAPPKTTAGS